MQAIAQQGHTVGLVTLHELAPAAIENSGVEQTWCLSNETKAKDNAEVISLGLTKSQEKFRSYWGIETSNIVRIGEIASEFQADAVIVVGLNVLPYLGTVKRALRIWYAGDEWAWHHVSQVKWLQPSSWGELKQALIKGLYERAYAPMLDRVWMVSNADKKAIRFVAGVKNVDVLPNGVDTQYYQPIKTDSLPESCVFWGRLDFGPNIQALEWFCKHVWNKIRAIRSNARFTIFGFQPTSVVEQLAASYPGIELVGNLPDIREAICRHQVVVLPFTSGGGIKNKLLEASALGKAIVCSPRTVNELSAGKAVVVAKNPQEWVEALTTLWVDADRRTLLGQAARDWVMKEHTWNAVAVKATQGLEESLNPRTGP